MIIEFEVMVCFYVKNILIWISENPTVFAWFYVKNLAGIFIFNRVFVKNCLMRIDFNAGFPNAVICFAQFNSFFVIPISQSIHISNQNQLPVWMIKWRFYSEKMRMLLNYRLFCRLKTLQTIMQNFVG